MEFVSVRQGEKSETAVTVTRARAEALGLDVLDQPAVDKSRRPLGPRPVVKSGTSDTVADVLSRVGDDPTKAQEALEVENQRSKPRTTLVDQLTAITTSGQEARQ